MNRKTLFIKDNTGAIRRWTISIEEPGLVIAHGQIKGSVQHKEINIESGKGGRTRIEQQLLMMKSRIKKQRDKGYVDTIEQAMEGRPTNALGLVKPMLAQRRDKVKKINMNNLYAQYKYNGHRCLITEKNCETIAYTRNGKLITSIDHILKQLVLGEGQTIDGELYIHGQSLQSISSLIRKKQNGSEKLKYIAYDVVMDDPYVDRLDCIQKITNFTDERVIVAPTSPVLTEEDITQCFINAKKNNYEGLILRQDGFGYEDGKRSKSLVKIKSCLDNEYEVIDVIPSSDNWGILVCKAENGKTFKVTAPGSMENKRIILDNKDGFIGQHVNVGFAEYTDDGIPFHPVASYFRNKKGE